jgi:hypothetical protein
LVINAIALCITFYKFISISIVSDTLEIRTKISEETGLDAVSGIFVFGSLSLSKEKTT